MKQKKEVDWVKLGKIMQSQNIDPDIVKKEYDRLVRESFSVGDHVCGDGWYYGIIVKICTDIAYVKNNFTNTVTCFKLNELKHDYRR